MTTAHIAETATPGPRLRVFLRAVRHPLPWLFVLGALYYLALKIHQFQNFHVGGELSDFESRLWNTLHGHVLARRPDEATFCQDHFSPILLLLLPLYALMQSPVTLIVVQALAAAAAVFPLYALTGVVLRHRWAPPAFALVYLLSRMLNYGLMYEFHMEVFYPLFFLTAFWAYESRRWKLLLLALILCLCVKEDAAVCATGLIWLIATMALIIPAFRSGLDRPYGFLHYWSGYGDSWRDILAGMLNPLTHLKVIFTPFKLSKMFNLFSVFLFLPLLNGRRLVLLVLPQWFVLYASDNRLMNGTMLYYGLLILPFLLYVSMLNLRDLAGRLSGRRRPVVALALALLVVVNVTNSRLFKQLHPGYWEVEERHRTVSRLLKDIPADAPVSAQIHLLPHLPARAYKDVLPWGLERSAYLLFDTRGVTWPMTPERNAALLDSLRAAGSWEVMAEAEGYVFLARAPADSVSSR
jgi:uncharacterized membrane protein